VKMEHDREKSSFVAAPATVSGEPETKCHWQAISPGTEGFQRG
jgi:hypothetical protein